MYKYGEYIIDYRKMRAKNTNQMFKSQMFTDFLLHLKPKRESNTTWKNTFSLLIIEELRAETSDLNRQKQAT